jgi:cytochrome c oxidase cbb3-type subunit 3
LEKIVSPSEGFDRWTAHKFMPFTSLSFPKLCALPKLGLVISWFLGGVLLFAAVLGSVALAAAQNPEPAPPAYAPELVERGSALFGQQCAFCHGRDAGGGENGPDLTRSKVVLADVRGDQIAPIIRNGSVEKGMPPFPFPDQEIAALVAFIHDQTTKAASRKGGRRGVEVADLQTGNAERGKQYFNGTGKCSTCHSPTGDLAGIARRFEGLKLEERMLYPRGAKAKVAVTLPSGETLSGELAYHDEFTIGMRDSSRRYRSWPTKKVKYAIDAPAEVHAELLPKYTDSDIHDLMAYLQTLR